MLRRPLWPDARFTAIAPEKTSEAETELVAELAETDSLPLKTSRAETELVAELAVAALVAE